MCTTGCYEHQRLAIAMYKMSSVLFVSAFLIHLRMTIICVVDIGVYILLTNKSYRHRSRILAIRFVTMRLFSSMIFFRNGSFENCSDLPANCHVYFAT